MTVRHTREGDPEVACPECGNPTNWIVDHDLSGDTCDDCEDLNCEDLMDAEDEYDLYDDDVFGDEEDD